MMDFGFAAFLEKFESYYGKRATRAVLGLMGFTIVVACGSLIWSQLLRPSIDLVRGVSESGSGRIVNWLSTLWTALIWGAGLGVGFVLVGGYRVWRSTRKLDALIERAELVQNRSTDALHRAVHHRSKRLGRSG
jgi:hypothetical protein